MNYPPYFNKNTVFFKYSNKFMLILHGKNGICCSLNEVSATLRC